MQWPHDTDGEREALHSGFLCYVAATSPGMAGLSPRVPSHRPAPQPLSPTKTPRCGDGGRGRAQRSRQRGRSGRAVGGEVAPRPRRASQPKFVNSGGGGRAPRRTSERRGGARAARSLTGAGEEAGGAEQRAAERGQQAGARHAAHKWGARRGTEDRDVQTERGLSLLLLDRNKSGSAAPPTGPRAPPRPARGGLGAGLRSWEGGRGCGVVVMWGTQGFSPPISCPATPRPASGLGLV